MGYRAKKLKLNRKIGKIKGICLIVFVVLLTAFIVFSYFYPPESWKYHVAKPKVEACAEGELRISFLDVGQGDATLIRFPDGKTMLIDGGDDKNENKRSLMRYLNAAGIDFIDYLVLTHTDSDHCGGLTEVVKFKDVGKVYLPLAEDYNVNAGFARLYAEAQKKGLSIETADISFKISSTDPRYPYELYCLSPYMGAELSEEANENCAVLWLDYKGVSTIFCADAPQSIEERLIRDQRLGLLNCSIESTEIIKMPHHGSNDGASLEFLEFLGVKTAVISVGKDNIYGHPSTETLTRLSSVGADVYRTDEQGHIVAVITSDGNYEMIGESR